MAELSASFNELFRKYRLKAEIPTLSEFGHLLAEKGFNYEDSIFSHWQNGTRIPQYRNILIKLIEIFAERRAITTVGEANQLLASANQGYLSEKELAKIPLKFASQVFQVPSEVSNFSGREGIIEKLIFKTDIAGKVVVIHGPAGVGKTALAIKLGHLLRDKYKDGVFWYKIEEDNIMDILLSIAKVLGEDISGINDLQVRGTVVRSLLASKNILLFLDSAELYPDIHLLIPNSKFCTTIITSQKSQIKAPLEIVDLKLEAFTNDETLEFFKNILKENYTKLSKNVLLKIAKRVGNLPLAIGLLARELKQRDITTDNEESLFQDLYREDKSLNSAISISYDKLSIQNKSVLVSASIFKGKDFSVESIAYINGISKGIALSTLEHLSSLSLVEYSTKSRFRIHPAIKDFVRNKLNYPRSSHLSFLATIIFGFYLSWWICLQLFVEKGATLYHLFSGCYFILPLYGGLYGVNTSIKWGGYKTLLGRAILMFSVGLFLQVFGQIAYSAYTNIFGIRVPYPSIGDIGYFGTIPFYIYGVFLLAQSSGIRINIQLFRREVIALIVPTAMVLLAYFLFLQDYKFDFKDPVKIFLDFGYPLGEAVYISIAIIIFIFSRTILDGIMRSKALLLVVALFLQFITDYLFVYDANNFYAGNYIDLLYLIAYFSMTLALLSLRSINIKVY